MFLPDLEGRGKRYSSELPHSVEEDGISKKGSQNSFCSLYHPYSVGESLILTAVCREEFLAILTCSYLSLWVA